CAAAHCVPRTRVGGVMGQGSLRRGRELPIAQIREQVGRRALELPIGRIDDLHRPAAGLLGPADQRAGPALIGPSCAASSERTCLRPPAPIACLCGQVQTVAGGGSVVGVVSGTVNQKVDPWPGALSTPTSPPWRSTMALLIARPNPRLTPEPLCTLTVSICAKRPHTRVCSLSDRPGPTSRTATRATRARPPSSLSPSSAPSASTTTSTGWLTREYLSALLR